MFKRLVILTNEYKIIRGMISYGTLWPLGSLIEQTLVEKRNYKTYDWMKFLRYIFAMSYIEKYRPHVTAIIMNAHSKTLHSKSKRFMTT